ncbi:PhnD/SsuA/transferrin family substrate-binding protein [uncultured Pseudoteredinibacter sp.]|uniref:phosphate/phosphite/phosphonate ABC transporter substrate-binding protein n=1 Tax=uncultured Pseudoteredinibacter sp. TaxID=1641701 RepID=UPI002614E4A0|nr:PhnD/SsuA/transferrin family substrate-binding protein [uncultured Pseudoteredinibacter sp.]
MLLRLIIILIVFFSGLPIKAEELRISQLSDRPKKDFTELRPMVRYAAQHIKSPTIDSFKVRLFKKFETLCSAIKTGKTDWITETAYVAARLQQECGAIPIAVKWKKQQKQYRSLIFSKTTTDIDSLYKLPGKVLAVESENSFSSFYIPLKAIQNKGLHIKRLHSPRNRPNDDEVGYFFSRNEKNNVKMVLKGIVDAGAINDGDWNNLSIISKHEKQQLRIIYRSKPYPRSFELVSPMLSQSKREALKALLFNKHGEIPEDILRRYENSSGFGPITTEHNDLLLNIAHSREDWK